MLLFLSAAQATTGDPFQRKDRRSAPDLFEAGIAQIVAQLWPEGFTQRPPIEQIVGYVSPHPVPSDRPDSC